MGGRGIQIETFLPVVLSSEVATVSDTSSGLLSEVFVSSGFSASAGGVTGLSSGIIADVKRVGGDFR